MTKRNNLEYVSSNDDIENLTITHLQAKKNANAFNGNNVFACTVLQCRIIDRHILKAVYRWMLHLGLTFLQLILMAYEAPWLFSIAYMQRIEKCSHFLTNKQKAETTMLFQCERVGITNALRQYDTNRTKKKRK